MGIKWGSRIQGGSRDRTLMCLTLHEICLYQLIQELNLQGRVCRGREEVDERDLLLSVKDSPRPESFDFVLFKIDL